mmetsp:Transcript_41265/g.131195  ORF Transcript_41265/g.131195 Transcript_41265/m.131195 type:complete len:286 (+) Transcript_41265:538-1395(+)
MIIPTGLPLATCTGDASSAIAWPQHVAACRASTHFGAFVSTMEGSTVLSCASNHQTTQFAVPSAVAANSRSLRAGTALTSACPRSNERSSAGSLSTRKLPSRLSRSTPVQSVSSSRSAGQKGRKASRLTPASSGNRSSQSTACSRRRAGSTGAPATQRRSRAPRVRSTRFSPKPEASMSSLTNRSNFKSSGGADTPRMSVHQISNGAASTPGSGSALPPAPWRFTATISSEIRAMGSTTSTPTAALAPARSAIMERIPSPLPTSRTRHPPPRDRTAVISACKALS